MNLSQDAAIALENMLEGGAVTLLLADLRAELDDRSKLLINLDLEDADGASKAKKLQGEIRGGHQVLDRIEELIRERAHPQHART